MTTRLDDDKTPLLPLGFDQAELRSGLRVTRAQFARLLGVSRQAVTTWVRNGKIAVGVDGLIDPRAAVAQLLRHSDPARVRARILEPLVRDVGVLQRRVAELENRLAAALEDAEFYEAVSDELLGQQTALLGHLGAERSALSALSGGEVVAAVETWLRRAAESGRFDPSTPLLGEQAAEPESELAELLRLGEEADASFAAAFGDGRALHGEEGGGGNFQLGEDTHHD
jgi:transcriptional regulator with XRE-family HTH domain